LVAIACFEAAFQPAAATEDDQDASSSRAGPRDDARGAAAVLELQPTQHPVPPTPARCVVEVATAQHCLAVAALSLAVLARGLRLHSGAAPAAGEEAELLGCVVAEFMQHGDEYAQVLHPVWLAQRHLHVVCSPAPPCFTRALVVSVVLIQVDPLTTISVPLEQFHLFCVRTVPVMCLAGPGSLSGVRAAVGRAS